MNRHPSRPVSGRRVPSRLPILIAAMGYRRWLFHPWQMTLGHCMVIVAWAGTILVLLKLPQPMVIFLLVLASAVFGSFRLRWHGFRLADMGMLLAIIILTAAVLLPAMIVTRHRTAGKRVFPFAVPQHCVERFYGRE